MDVVTTTADDNDTAYAEVVAQTDRGAWGLLSLRTHRRHSRSGRALGTFSTLALAPLLPWAPPLAIGDENHMRPIDND
jgi:hypothetical protein|nr:hypothetical protein [Aeromicrobium sp.]